MLNTITTMRLPDGREVALVDWTDRPLYSTVEILHGSTQQEMNLFQYTVGDNVPAFAPVAIAAQRTANEMDTNMATPGSMASTEEMLVYSIRPEIYALNVSDAQAPNFAAPAALANDGTPNPTAVMLAVMDLRMTMSLEISEKVYSNAGFGYYNWGAGVYAVTADAGDRAIGMPGLPSQEAVRTFAIPQHIGGQEKFRLFLTHVDDGTGNGIELGHASGGNNDTADDTDRFARIRIYLDGLYKRPVS